MVWLLLIQAFLGLSIWAYVVCLEVITGSNTGCSKMKGKKKRARQVNKACVSQPNTPFSQDREIPQVVRHIVLTGKSPWQSGASSTDV